MKITATKPHGNWQITIDGHPMRLKGASKYLNIHRDTIGKALRRGGAKELLNVVEHHARCKSLGILVSTRLYERNGEYAWSRLVTEQSGVCGSHAYRLLRDWSAGEIDCDDLFRPPMTKKQLNIKRSGDGLSKKRGDWDLGPMTPRKDIKSLPRPTKHDWDNRNVNTTRCCPGSGRGSGGSCRY